MMKPSRHSLELYDKVDADFVMPVDETPQFDIIMVNSWSFLFDELNMMTKHSNYYYDYDRNDPDEKIPFLLTGWISIQSRLLGR